MYIYVHAFLSFAAASAAAAAIVRLGVHPNITHVYAMNDSLPGLPILMERPSYTLRALLQENGGDISTLARHV